MTIFSDMINTINRIAMSVANPVNPVNPVKNTPPVAIRKSHVPETREARITPRPRQETFPRADDFGLKGHFPK